MHSHDKCHFLKQYFKVSFLLFHSLQIGACWSYFMDFVVLYHHTPIPLYCTLGVFSSPVFPQLEVAFVPRELG